MCEIQDEIHQQVLGCRGLWMGLRSHWVSKYNSILGSPNWADPGATYQPKPLPERVCCAAENAWAQNMPIVASNDHQSLGDITSAWERTKAEIEEIYRDCVRKAAGKAVSRLIPPEFTKPIQDESLSNQRAFQEVMRWKPKSGGSGLICFGPTGSGKTRSVYTRLRELMVEDLVTFVSIGAVELAREIPKLSMEDITKCTAFVRRLAEKPDVLFIDDLHQAKLTPRYAQELYSIVNKRIEQNRPMIVTVQMTSERLLDKMAGQNNPDLRETAEAIVRRIREFCEPIDFGGSDSF
jgi:hypothetical protein